jgi:redox-sensing transcriptional repressor
MYSYLERLQEKGVEKVQSRELGQLLGVPDCTVRKDISFINKEKNIARSYNVQNLKVLIGGYFHFDKARNACVVGLGRIGTALLAYTNFEKYGFSIVAGFEDNINRLELIKTDVNLYPAYQIQDIVKREAIEIALVAVPADAAPGVIGVLVKAGVKEIVNFAPVVVAVPNDVIVKNVDFTQMMREVVAFKEMCVSEDNEG